MPAICKTGVITRFIIRNITGIPKPILITVLAFIINISKHHLTMLKKKLDGRFFNISIPFFIFIYNVHFFEFIIDKISGLLNYLLKNKLVSQYEVKMSYNGIT
jgi:hypothetical protein